MALRLNPYVTFDGNAKEALEFYQGVFGGELTVNTFADFGGPPEKAEQIMHAQLETPAGFTLMAADPAPDQTISPGNNHSISIDGEDADTLNGYWSALSDGGTVTVPLEKQMWGDVFGMCIDRFGVTWMVNITAPQDA